MLRVLAYERGRRGPVAAAVQANDAGDQRLRAALAVRGAGRPSPQARCAAPDLEVTYKKCVVTLWTHVTGGLGDNDFICAVKVGALAGG